MKKMKKIGFRTVALLFVFAMAATVLCSCGKKPNEVKTLKTENFTVTAGMLAYSLYDTYYYYINYYGEQILSSYFGLDTSLSLREQYYDEEEGTTWFDVFLNDALYNGFVNALPLCEAALADGMELNEVDKKFIENEIQEITSMAEEQGMTFEEYIEELYGKGVTEQDIRSTLEIYRLANKKLYKDYDLAKVTDTEIEEYVAENPDSYLCRDVKYFTLTLSNETEKNEVIKTYAEKIATATTVEEFEAYANEFIASEYCVDDKPKVSSQFYQNSTAEDEKTELEKWIFADDTAIGSTYISESSTNYVVYMATSEAARDASETRNMYHILFSSDIYDSNSENLANSVYNEWKNGGESLETFKELSLKYTTDYASAYSGGYYANVASGDLTEELDVWLFDESRVPGDSAVITTEAYGVHIIYYAGEGEPYWKVPVIETLKDEKAAALMEEYAELYEVEVFEDNFKYVP